MGFVSIKRPAVFNVTENAFFETYTAINPETGRLETRTQVIEDTVERSITNNITNVITTELSVKIKNLSDQIFSQNLVFDIGESYISDSLAVYYNGLMITSGVSSKGSDNFTLSADYQNILETGDELFVSYVADNQ